MPAIGDKSVVTLTTSQGTTVKTGCGRSTVLAFVAVACPTCRLSLPSIDTLRAVVAPLGSDVIAVSQSSAAASQRLADALALQLPIVFDEGLQLSRRFDLLTVPTVIWIDRDGAVRSSTIG